MSFDPEMEAQFAADLAIYPGVSQRHMFGGSCFMQNGHMLCGVMRDGAMFRVGKANEAAALLIEGARELSFTGRKMGGMVETDIDSFWQDSTRKALLDLALGFVGSLPPK